MYIVTDDAITVAEAGRKTLIIPKSFDNFEYIKENISKMTYNDILDQVSLKTKFPFLSSDKVEVNVDDDSVTLNVVKPASIGHSLDVAELIKCVLDNCEIKDSVSPEVVSAFKKLKTLKISNIAITLE